MAAQKKTEKATEATKAEVAKTSVIDKIKESRPVKYLKVHGKDLLIGIGIGGGTTAAGFGIAHLVKANKAKQELDIDELPVTEDDPYLSEVTSSDEAAPTEE